MHEFANKMLLVNEVLDLTRESKLPHKKAVADSLEAFAETIAVSE